MPASVHHQSIVLPPACYTETVFLSDPPYLNNDVSNGVIEARASCSARPTVARPHPGNKVQELQTTNPIFIGGVPRSGTTLVRVILDTHPRIFCGTELRVVPALAGLWHSFNSTAQPLLESAYAVDAERLRDIFSDLVLAFLTPSWEASGKPRVAEKTPFNILVFPELARLFPDAPLVHVIRDVRDVVASRLERDRAFAGGGGLGSSVDTIALARIRAEEWVAAMAVRRQMLLTDSSSRTYFELRYEDLVSSPHTVLAALFAFLGETFDPAVLDYHRIERNVDGSEEWSADAVRKPLFASSYGRWRKCLSADELSSVIQVAGPVLQELGYDASA